MGSGLQVTGLPFGPMPPSVAMQSLELFGEEVLPHLHASRSAPLRRPGLDAVPTVLRIRGYRCFFYMQEGREPAHVHVDYGGNEAKFWLSPVAVAFNKGYADHELRRIEAVIVENLGELEIAWQRIHDH